MVASDVTSDGQFPTLRKHRFLIETVSCEFVTQSVPMQSSFVAQSRWQV